ncbi:MAG: hypothetical protein R6V32_11245 [Bacteroidales bacterium]
MQPAAGRHPALWDAVFFAPPGRVIGMNSCPGGWQQPASHRGDKGRRQRSGFKKGNTFPAALKFTV